MRKISELGRLDADLHSSVAHRGRNHSPLARPPNRPSGRTNNQYARQGTGLSVVHCTLFLGVRSPGRNLGTGYGGMARPALMGGFQSSGLPSTMIPKTDQLPSTSGNWLNNGWAASNSGVVDVACWRWCMGFLHGCASFGPRRFATICRSLQ